MAVTLEVKTLIEGHASAELLVLSEGLSFWGGLDPATGAIIDRQHPQEGQVIRDRILALPAPRGSTAAPGALLECLAAGKGPAGIIQLEQDPTPTAAVLAAHMIGMPTIPVAVLVDTNAFLTLATGRCAVLGRGSLKLR